MKRKELDEQILIGEIARELTNVARINGEFYEKLGGMIEDLESSMDYTEKMFRDSMHYTDDEGNEVEFTLQEFKDGKIPETPYGFKNYIAKNYACRLLYDELNAIRP